MQYGADTYAPPMKTFLNENDISDKNIALFECHGSSGGEKCFSQFEKALNNKNIKIRLELQDSIKTKSEETEKQIEMFCENIVQSI